MNTWRVRKLAPWEHEPDALGRWVVERAEWGTWRAVVFAGCQSVAFAWADRQARR